VSLAILEGVGLAAIAALVLWTTLASGARRIDDGALVPPVEPVSIAAAAHLGSASAPVVLVEFSDFQCPFCRRFGRETMPQVIEQYVARGDLAVVFRHLPLSIHAVARDAAIAAECARRQEQFWSFHDDLFTAPSVTAATIRGAWRRLGHDERELDACSADAASVVNADVALAERIGITGTPAFLVGLREPGDRVRVVRMVEGAVPFSSLVSVLDDVRKKVR